MLTYPRAVWHHSIRTLSRYAGRPEEPVSYDLTASDIARLFDRRGIAFVHIPKTGGTALGRALYGIDIGHLPWDKILSIHPIRFHRWFKFAVVRDPVERFLSAYDYLRAGGINKVDAAFGKKFIAPHPDVDGFVAGLAGDTDNRQRVMAFWHFRPQSSFVATQGRRVMVDALLPFETLRRGSLTINGFELADIPVTNITAGKRTPRAALSDQALGTIEEIYEPDFAMLAGAGTGHVYGARF